MTTLPEYIQAKGLTLDQFGELIGRSGATVSRIARGIHKPDWSTMEAILKATDGEVDPNSFSGLAAGDDAQAFGGNKPHLAEPDETVAEIIEPPAPTETSAEITEDVPPLPPLVSGTAAFEQ